MKRAGLIGGISYLATLDVYRHLNEQINSRLGKKNGSIVTIDSVDLQDMVEALETSTEAVSKLLLKSALRLQNAQCEFIIIACNTAHVAYELMQKQTQIPILHIADSCAAKARDRKAKVLGLLGSRTTTENSNVLIRRLQMHGLTVLVPDKAERDFCDDVINRELCFNVMNLDSKTKLMATIHGLIQRGAEGIILGCTELPLLIKEQDLPRGIAVLDTAALQAEAAASIQVGASKLPDYLPATSPARSKL